MSDVPRYRALSNGLKRRRGKAFRLCIQGEDQLVEECDDVTAEGAATSLQLHLRINPR